MSGGVSSCNMADVHINTHSYRPWRPFGLQNWSRSLALVTLFMSSLVLTARVTDAEEVSDLRRSLTNDRASPRLARVPNGLIQTQLQEDDSNAEERGREVNSDLDNSAETAIRRISQLINFESNFGVNERPNENLSQSQNRLNTQGQQQREGRERSIELSSQEDTDAPRQKKGFSVFSRMFPYFGPSGRSGLQQRSMQSDDYLESQPQTRRSSSRPFRPRLRWG